MALTLRIGAAVAFRVGLGVPPPGCAADVEQTQTTDSYKIVLSIGPAETMLMPDEAAGATAGEVMVEMPGMAMPSTSPTDQGMPVNHHLEAKVYDKATGALLKDTMPM